MFVLYLSQGYYYYYDKYCLFTIEIEFWTALEFFKSE